jgi:hypothetical protein
MVVGEWKLYERVRFQIEVAMLCISIEVNGRCIATIDLAGMDVVNVSVHGALDREQKAILSATGGNYAEGGCGHLIWIAERGLLPGDVLRVMLSEAGDIATRGKTIAELYPDEESSTKPDFSISDKMAEEIRARPRLHEGFVVQVETSLAQEATATSDDLNTDFTFSFFWDRFRSNQVRVRLATYCLDDVLARTGGTEHLKNTLSIGDDVRFSVLQ